MLFSLSSCCKEASCPFTMTPKAPSCPYETTLFIPPSFLLLTSEVYQKNELSEVCTISLAEVLKLALINSQKMAETYATTKIRASQYGQAFSPLYPQISGNTYYEIVKNGSAFANNFAFPDQYIDYGTYVSVSWLLFDTGATCANIETFRQQLFAANFSHNRSIQSVLETTFKDYYDFIKAKEEVRASLANLKDAETILSATSLKHELGISDVVDELQAKTQVAKRQLDLLGSEEALVDDKANLIKDLGIPANSLVDFQDLECPPDIDKKLPSLDFYVLEGYKYRPDLFAAFSEVRASASNVNYQNRNQWFKGNFSGTGGCITFDFQNTPSRGLSPIYDAVVSLSVPIFSGYEYLNKIREAKGELARAKAKMRQLELDMIAEITTSYENLKIATNKVKTAFDYLNFAEQSYKASLNRYQAGVIDFQTLINALTDLADARYSLAESKRDWYVSLTDLLFATGTLTPGCAL